MAKTTLLDLPEEILEKIFLLVPWLSDDDLSDIKWMKTLTEVCKKFKKVISLNTKFMELLTVSWKDLTEKDKDALLKSDRKYKSINIQEHVDETLFKFIDIHQATITEISLSWQEFKISDINLLFEKVADNLKTLCVEDVKIVNDTAVIPVKLPKLNNVNIARLNDDDRSTHQIVDFLRNAENIRKISMSGFIMASGEDGQKIIEWICASKNLKSLILGISIESDIFKTNYIAENATFQLEEFDSHLYFEQSGEYRHLNPFLIQQNHYLTKVSLKLINMTNDMIEVLFSMKNLKSLKLAEINFGHSFRIPIISKSIKELTIALRNAEYNAVAETAICTILQKCPNIQTLNLEQTYVSFEISLFLSKNFKFLKKLAFRWCAFVFVMLFPTIETLEVRSRETNTATYLLRMNPQIQYLNADPGIQNHPKYAEAIANVQKIHFFET